MMVKWPAYLLSKGDKGAPMEVVFITPGREIGMCRAVLEDICFYVTGEEGASCLGDVVSTNILEEMSTVQTESE